MTFHDDWKALAARIRGIVDSGELHARFLAINSSDTYNRSRRLREHCEKTLHSIERYAITHKGRIPAPAVAAINDFVETHRNIFTDASGSSDSIAHRTWAALVLLSGLESEISYLLTSSQEQIRTRSERALSHLQRSIVADSDIRAKWMSAWKEGEVACEKRGATHLLAHGIYAFKVNSEGERTDLVFQDVLGHTSDPSEFSDGLVLTEWKKAKTQSDVTLNFNAARKQATRYASGGLGGAELTDYRFLIVVSEDFADHVDDLHLNGVTYRHINVAVNPKSPSRAK